MCLTVEMTQQWPKNVPQCLDRLKKNEQVNHGLPAENDLRSPWSSQVALEPQTDHRKVSKPEIKFQKLTPSLFTHLLPSGHACWTLVSIDNQ